MGLGRRRPAWWLASWPKRREARTGATLRVLASRPSAAEGSLDCVFPGNRPGNWGPSTLASGLATRHPETQTNGDGMTTQANPSSDAEDAATEREDSRHRVQAGREFESHFVAYLMVNAVLVAVWVVTGAGYFWPGWVIAAWGAALVLYDGYVYLANALRRPNERSRRSVHRRRRRARHITQAFARHGLGWLIGPRLGRHLVPWRRHRWAHRESVGSSHTAAAFTSRPRGTRPDLRKVGPDRFYPRRPAVS